MQELSVSLAAAVQTAASSIVQVSAGQARASGVIWSVSPAGAPEPAGVSSGASSAAGASGDVLIVTVAHLLEDDGDISVMLAGGERQQAELVGRDPGTDLAVLRISGAAIATRKELTPLAFREHGQLAVGHLALALGRPGQSVRASLRIVGVLGPEVRTPGGGRLERYIESDRRIPRGFSGGPLVDMHGQGIGINSRAVMRGADVAIPPETVRRVVGELLARGTAQPGYLGVGVYPVRLPAKLAEELGQERGALVVGVEEGSPAEVAGLFLGDVLVSLGGDPVHGPRELRNLLYSRAGTTIEARIVRAGALATVTVTAGERPAAG